eukprot:TRINITY_DN1220_c0_g1_i1.p1 TRINITY_DN1220_c0_g1~~TRINITY_DN1220_c0_g1_i1.p1  ORF type:complete len:242 (+),score=35.71 TRINITY_DN1220_c0_g1_i1:135-860(+)
MKIRNETLLSGHNKRLIPALLILGGAYYLLNRPYKYAFYYYCLIWFCSNFSARIGWNHITYKRKNGTFPIIPRLFWYPYYLTVRIYLSVFRLRHKSQPVVSTIMENKLYLSGWLNDKELLPEELKKSKHYHIVDMTNEFPRIIMDNTKYTNVPCWDGTMPKYDEFKNAVISVSSSFEKIPIIIMCAHGRGRSFTFLVACLLYLKQFDTIEECFDFVYEKRPIVKFHPEGLKLLEKFQLEIC